jgi:rfaE bifunctional protein nucleotidyltransferase chain/domain/rfaE bifunctional protein kinase chain/domain
MRSLERLSLSTVRISGRGSGSRSDMLVRDLPARWQGRSVLVVGDALLDGWYSGSPQRLCREAPVPVVDIERVEYACGGAANAAANVAALGGRAILAAVVGGDADGAILRRRLRAAGVDSRLATARRRHTLAKRRILAHDQIVVRFDRGDQRPMPDAITAELRRHVDDALDEGLDAVVVCDYGAGTLDRPVRDLLRRRRADLPLLVVDAHDPRPWASIRPDLVTPSFTEAARLFGGADGEADRASWVVNHADGLLDATRAGALAVTLDSDGAVVLRAGQPAHRTHTHPVPASRTAGAGDAYVAAFTLALASGVPFVEAADAAQLAAVTATRHAGTAVCHAGDLLIAARRTGSGVLELEALVQQVAAHRAQRHRVVFTNGCFDVLHSGHVGYLEQARRLGDVLVVAVNSDDSVRRLKGANRPVNPVEDRAAVLAALSCVDYVVVFEEDSPAAVISALRPDVYVKGGDYRPELIPEAPLVCRLGGKVLTLDYVPDRSTSQIIERIRGTARVST